MLVTTKTQVRPPHFTILKIQKEQKVINNITLTITNVYSRFNRLMKRKYTIGEELLGVLHFQEGSLKYQDMKPIFWLGTWLKGIKETIEADILKIQGYEAIEEDLF